jgi:hypothetical protein
VRWPISCERAVRTIDAPCCSSPFAGTNDMLYRVTASQIARINRIRLAALDIVRRHQLHGVPELDNLTRPIMRIAARLHADGRAPSTSSNSATWASLNGLPGASAEPTPPLPVPFESQTAEFLVDMAGA